MITLRHEVRRYKVNFMKKEIIFAARPGTTDPLHIKTTFSDRFEYPPPVKADPKVIFDVGAHIGSVSVYYSLIYPRAKIYAFEPFPENYNLLKLNSRENSVNIIPVEAGLGSRGGNFIYHPSEDPRNAGGGTFGDIGCDRSRRYSLPIISVKKFIRDKKVRGIDILKVDAEGMEFDIITAIPLKVLKRIKYIVGECHGIRDMELLRYLSRYFYLGFNKDFGDTIFVFKAVNKEIYGTCRKKKKS